MEMRLLRILDKGGQITGIHELRVDLKVFFVGILKFDFTDALNSIRLRF